MKGTTEDIRAALAGEEYAKASRLWKRYAEGLRESVQNLSASEADLEEARRLVSWANTLVKCRRAEAEAMIGEARGRAAYAAAAPREPRMRALL